MENLKKCSKCGNVFPATKEYFHASKCFKDGLRNNCRKCRAQEHKEYKERSLSSRKYGVYKVINNVNGKVYIGSSGNLNSRRNSHFATLRKGKNPNKNLQEEYNLYGDGNFAFEILELVENAEGLISREQYWLDYYKVNTPGKLYNFNPRAGSALGYKHSEEAIKKSVATRIGVPLSAEHKANLSIAKSGKNHHFYGQKLSDEHRKKISSSMIGVNIGENCPTHKLTEEEILQIRALLKNGTSQSEIAKMFNICQSHVSRIKSKGVWKHI